MAVLVWGFLLLAAQGGSVEWQLDDSFTPEDRAAILSLCSQMGMDHPHRISITRFHPGPCRFLLAESEIVQSGIRRSWSWFWMQPRDWAPCLRAAPDSLQKTAGRFVASSSGLRTSEQWRIRDGQWYHDVDLGPGVSYTDAELVVLESYRHRLVCGFSGGCDRRPEIDADTIRSIRRAEHGNPGFRVWTGDDSGGIFDVRIVGTRVAVYSVGQWMP